MILGIAVMAEWSQCIKGLIFHVSDFLLPLFLFPDSVWADAKGVSREHVLFVNNLMLLLPLLLYLHLLIPLSLCHPPPLSLQRSPSLPGADTAPPPRLQKGLAVFFGFFSLLSPVADSRVNVWRPCAGAVGSKIWQNLKRSNDLRPSVITGDWKWKRGGGAARITSHMCMNKWSPF